MTSFCSQCGNQIRSGGKFCQSCGAQAGQSSQGIPASGQGAPAQTSNPQGSGYQSAYAGGLQGGSFPPQTASQSTYGTPPASSNKTLKIILITLAVLAVIAVGSVAAVTFMIRRAVNNIVTVEEGANGQPRVELNVPGAGKISVNSGINEAQLGVPIYPGATPDKDGSGTVSVSNQIPGQSGWFGAATFTTDDTVDEVAEFYRDTLGEKASTVDSASEGKRQVIFTLQTEQGFRMVTIGEEDGKTKLVIASAGNTARPAQ